MGATLTAPRFFTTDSGARFYALRNVRTTGGGKFHQGVTGEPGSVCFAVYREAVCTNLLFDTHAEAEREAERLAKEESDANTPDQRGRRGFAWCRWNAIPGLVAGYPE